MGGFVFGLAGIESVLKEWQALQEELYEDKELALPLVQVVGPGEEPASWGMVTQATASGVSFLRHNAEMRAVVDQYIAALIASRNDYLRSDEANREIFTRDGNR